MTQIVGIVDFYWGGAKVDIQNDGTFKRGGLINKSKVVGRKIFRSQQMVNGEVSITTILQRGQAMSDIFPGDEAEVQVHCDTGQIFISDVGFITDDAEVTFGDNHGVKVTIQGNEFVEQKAP